MANFLKPDKTISTPNGLKIKQKIIPDSLLAPKDVAAGRKEIKKINKEAGKTKADVAADDKLKDMEATYAAQQKMDEKYGRANAQGQRSGGTLDKEKEQDVLRQRAIGQAQQSLQGTIDQQTTDLKKAKTAENTAQGNYDTAKKDYDAKQAEATALREKEQSGAHMSHEERNRLTQLEGQNGVGGELKAASDAMRAAATALQNATAAREKAQGALDETTAKSKNVEKAAEHITSGFEEDRHGNVGIGGDLKIEAKKGEITSEEMQSGLSTIKASKVEADKRDDEIDEREAKRRADAVNEGKKDLDEMQQLDTQAIGEGVQQGLNEAMAALSEAMTKAFSNAKVTVNDIKQISTEIRQLKNDMKKANDAAAGAERDKAMAEIAKAIQELTKKLK